MTPFAAVVFLVVPNVNYEILILWEVVFLVKGNDTPPPLQTQTEHTLFQDKVVRSEVPLSSMFCQPCSLSTAPHYKGRQAGVEILALPLFEY